MFYTYLQNNSGGDYIIDDSVCPYLIIEADSEAESDEIALSLGVYFNGCEKGLDCSCCGDRWWGASQESESPMIYGTIPEEYNPVLISKGEVYCRVYYKNGNVDEHKVRLCQ